MDIPILLVADYANVEQSGKLNVMGVFTEIFAPGFPVKQGEMYLVAKLTFNPAEYGTSRKLTIKLLDEDASNEVVNWSRVIDVPKREGEVVEINQILRLQDVIFPAPGAYRFYALVDDDVKASVPIIVTKRD